MIEFLALASSSLLKLGQENVHTSPNRESIYLLLGDIVKSSKVRNYNFKGLVVSTFHQKWAKRGPTERGITFE